MELACVLHGVARSNVKQGARCSGVRRWRDWANVCNGSISSQSAECCYLGATIRGCKLVNAAETF